jgi:hypothetical protein
MKISMGNRIANESKYKKFEIERVAPGIQCDMLERQRGRIWKENKCSVCS